MKEFFAWVVAPANINANIFTFLTVILSGIISWAISFAFYYKGNRDGLTANILQPMKEALSGPYTKEKFKELEALSRGHSSKYLNPNEREIIRSLLQTYKDVYYYDHDYVSAECLFFYFVEKTRQNGITPEIEPQEINDEIVGMQIPYQLNSDMVESLYRALKKYPLDYDEENCVWAITSIFNSFCSQYYSSKKIAYFDDCTLEDVLTNSVVRENWDKKFDTLKQAKDSFMKLKLLSKK